MPDKYDLLKERWLPVIVKSEQREFVSLSDISRPDILRVSTGRPDCDISLTEFLIGMLAVACGPRDDEEWHERFTIPPTAEELQAAFAPYAPALVLDGDGPRFFQDFETLDGEAGSISGLLIDAPGVSTLRDNADHFVKRGRTECLSRAGAAMVLATLQTCAPSGGAGHRTSLRGGGPLTTLVVPGSRSHAGSTLWHRLWANVPLAPSYKPDPQRVFPWLTATRVSDKAGVSTTPADVDQLQAFFGMPRRIRLVFEQNTDKRRCDLLGIVDDVVVIGYVTRPWGTNYEGWSKVHPLSPYYKTRPADPAFLPVHLQSARVGYREWLGFAFGAEDGLRLPAACVHAFTRRKYDFAADERIIAREARLLVAGYAMDNMKPLDFGEALMPLIVASTDLANDIIRRQAEGFVDAAKAVASQLTSCVRLALYGEKGKADADSAVLHPVRDRFWADSECDFFTALRDVADALDAVEDLQDAAGAIQLRAGEEWRAKLRSHALTIFDDTVPLENADSRRIGDIINARRMLLTALAGQGKSGGALLKALGLPPPEKPAKKSSRKPSEGRAP